MTKATKARLKNLTKLHNEIMLATCSITSVEEILTMIDSHQNDEAQRIHFEVRTLEPKPKNVQDVLTIIEAYIGLIYVSNCS